MHFRMSFVALISFPLILAGVILMKGEGGKTMAKTEHLEDIHEVLPPIDKDIPTGIETATFALG